MASTHKHLRSSTANKRPTTAIAEGQIALNTNSSSPGLFFKDSTGATIIKVGPVHIGATAPNATPPAGGSAGNSTGEVWLDTSLTPNGVKIWDGSAWVNATPIGSTTVQGLLELATNAETQTGADTARAVTPAGLQSKMSDSTSTTSSTTIASSTAVKAAYDLAAAALPLSGGTVTGNLEIGTTGSLSFEGATANTFETTIAVVDPTADRTITLPDTTGTVVTTGDTGTVTSTMIADGTIVNADINASAAIAGTKISPDFGSQNVVTTGTSTAASLIPSSSTVPSNGIYLPAANSVGIATNTTNRITINSTGDVNIDSGTLFVDATNNRVGINTTQTIYNGYPGNLTIANSTTNTLLLVNTGSAGTQNLGDIRFHSNVQNVSARVYATAISGSTYLQTEAYTFNGNHDVYSFRNLIGTELFFANSYGSWVGAPSTFYVDFATANVGIGTSVPGTKLQVYGQISASNGTAAAAAYTQIGDPNTGIYFPDADVTAITTNGSERLRIDQAGALLVGTQSARGVIFFNGTQTANVQIESTTFAGSALSITRNDNSGASPTLIFAKTRGTTLGSTTSVSSGDELGKITFQGADNTLDLVEGAQIRAEVDGTPGANDMPGRIVLATTSDGASSPTERMRITSSGRVGIGTSSPSEALHIASGGARISSALAGGGASSLGLDYSSSNARFISYGPDASTQTGFVFLTANSTASVANERLRIDSSGRVGIGTASPATPLHVVGVIASRNTTVGMDNMSLQFVETGSGNAYGVRIGQKANATLAFEKYDGSWGETARIDSSGNCLLGTTTAPSTNGSGIAIYNATFPRLTFRNSTTGDTTGDGTQFVQDGLNFNIANTEAGELKFFTSNTQRATIDSSGRVLVGTTTARTNVATISPGFQLEGLTNNNNRYAGFIYNAADVGGPEIHFAKSRGTALNTNTVVTSGDQIGTINFDGADGTNFIVGAQIRALVDGTPGANDMPGRLVFSTTADGASSPTERMRIANDGIVDIGSGGVGGNLRAMTISGSKIQFSNTNTATTNLPFIEFGRSATSPAIYTAEGDIRTDGSGNLAFNNASDVTLKENIRDLPECLTSITQLRPVLFDWKEEHKPCCTDIKGFIAQEFEQVLPKSVSTDENGIKSIAPVTELLPLLVGAIKELSAQVNELQAKVAALESA